MASANDGREVRIRDSAQDQENSEDPRPGSNGNRSHTIIAVKPSITAYNTPNHRIDEAGNLIVCSRTSTVTRRRTSNAPATATNVIPPTIRAPQKNAASDDMAHLRCLSAECRLSEIRTTSDEIRRFAECPLWVMSRRAKSIRGKAISRSVLGSLLSSERRK